MGDEQTYGQRKRQTNRQLMKRWMNRQQTANGEMDEQTNMQIQKQISR